MKDRIYGTLTAHALAVLLLLGCVLTGLTAVGGVTGKLDASADGDVYVWHKYDSTTKTLYLRGTEEAGYDRSTDSAHDWAKVSPASMTDAQWYATKVVIEDSIRPRTTSRWFIDFVDLVSFEGIGNLDTADVSDMSEMFNNCMDLQDVDLSGFDTSRVTNMSGMFVNCQSLVGPDSNGLDLSSFDTSRVTNMSNMFAHCSSLTRLDVSSFDTSQVTDMSYMFNDCYYLNALDVSGFDTSNVTNMCYIFAQMHMVTELDISGFDMSKVTDVSGFFWMDSQLKTIYAAVGTNWNLIPSIQDSDLLVFSSCAELRGENDTAYSDQNRGISYARIDGGPDSPGYFTAAVRVSFDAAGGTPKPHVQRIAPGGTAEEPEEPSREGYTFEGWFAPGADAAFDFSTPVNEFITLTAKWKQNSPAPQPIPSEIADSSENDPEGSTFAPLFFRAVKQSKNSVKLSWKQAPGAVRYAIYGNPCNSGGKRYTRVKLAEFDGSTTSLTVSSINGQKLKKGKYYKFSMLAFDAAGNQVASSKLVHAATKGGKVGNPTSVKVKKSKIKLKAGKTYKLKGKVKGKKIKKHRKLKYESSDPSVASVSGKGKVKALSKGSCRIYVYAQNGRYKTVKLTVK